MNRSRLLSSTLNTTALRLIGQVIALGSGILISSQFGATAATDDYYTALILPGSLANLVISVLTAVFAPIYLEYLHRDPDQDRPILSSLAFVATLGLIVAALISLIAVPLSVSARGISGPSEAERAVMFGVILVGAGPLIGYTRLIGVTCEARQHYSAPALGVLINPIVFMGTLAITAQPFGIYSLLVANLLGTVAEFGLITLYSVRVLRLPFGIAPRLHPAVREMLTRSASPALAYLAIFFVPTVDRAVATTLDAGSLTAFHYGERIVVAVDYLIMGGVLTVLSNYWANTAAQKGIGAVAESLPDGISLLGFGLIPLCIGGALLGQPVISVLFERGAFTAVTASAQVFSILLVSLFMAHYVVLFVRLLLVLKNTTAQLVLSLIIVVLNTVLNLTLAPMYGVAGIALSTLITRLIVVMGAVWYVRQALPNARIARSVPRLAHTALCTAVMAGVVVALSGVFAPQLARANGFLVQVLALIGVIGAGGAAYILSAALTRHPDFVMLSSLVQKTRLGRALRVFRP